MLAKLEFDLSEPDDRQAHLRCVKALDMALALWGIRQLSLKQESISNKEQKIYTKIDNILEDYNIVTEILIT